MPQKIKIKTPLSPRERGLISAAMKRGAQRHDAQNKITIVHNNTMYRHPLLDFYVSNGSGQTLAIYRHP